ncbi:MAG: T9SS type A sorting domain-containing protein, partial [Calditrichaeota bacterium]|nr:T9SS type A sorting domain-containing protein [Calditrichota bacterium]
ATVKLEIFNLIGEKVAELASGQQTAGTHTIIWNGRNRFDAQVASGVYLYRLQAGSFVQTRKMILLR